MTGVLDHPLRADCSTCRFAGRDGDLGEHRTCDAPLQGCADDDAWERIVSWADAGEVGPCPVWQPDRLADQRAVDQMERALGIGAAGQTGAALS